MPPPIGSSIPTLVSRGTDPLNGAGSKRPHSPSLEEQAKRLKETEKARIHIAWTQPSRWDSCRHTGGGKHREHDKGACSGRPQRDRQLSSDLQTFASGLGDLVSCCLGPRPLSVRGHFTQTSGGIWAESFSSSFFYSSSPWVFKMYRQMMICSSVELLLLFLFFQVTF